MIQWFITDVKFIELKSMKNHKWIESHDESWRWQHSKSTYAFKRTKKKTSKRNIIIKWHGPHIMQSAQCPDKDKFVQFISLNTLSVEWPLNRVHKHTFAHKVLVNRTVPSEKKNRIHKSKMTRQNQSSSPSVPAIEQFCFFILLVDCVCCEWLAHVGFCSFWFQFQLFDPLFMKYCEQTGVRPRT